MKISGKVICYDRPDICSVQTSSGQSATIVCTDSPDQFEASGIVINKTTWSSSGATFIQGQLLNDTTGLTHSFIDRRYQGWTQSDSTYIDGTYTEPRLYDPIRINYGIYHKYDGTHWKQIGYRYRTAMHPRVGFYYANMFAPDTLGTHRIEWIYRKDSSSYTTIDNQTFEVTNWGNQHNTGSIIPSGTGSLLIEALPAYLSKMPGETAVFTLRITGIVPAPTLTYEWRRYGINLTNGGKYSGVDTDTLVITDVSMAEYGSYDCIVSYIAQSTKAWLVIDPP